MKKDFLSVLSVMLMFAVFAPVSCLAESFIRVDMVMTERCPADCWDENTLAYYDDKGAVECNNENASETVCKIKASDLSAELFLLDEYTATCYNFIENSAHELSQMQYLDCESLLVPLMLKSDAGSGRVYY